MGGEEGFQKWIPLAPIQGRQVGESQPPPQLPALFDLTKPYGWFPPAQSKLSKTTHPAVYSQPCWSLIRPYTYIKFKPYAEHRTLGRQSGETEDMHSHTWDSTAGSCKPIPALCPGGGDNKRTNLIDYCEASMSSCIRAQGYLTNKGNLQQALNKE